MKNPYENLPSRSFWKPSVASKNLFDISEIWRPKFNINYDNSFATFGSCFAQHIGKALTQKGFNWLNTEKPPSVFSEEDNKKYNYNVFSARTGNIYTTTLLQQWTEWAIEEKEIPEEVWEKDGRIYDPFRPRIEPNGFSSHEEARQSLTQAVASFKKAIQQADFFVFTLGLTESWRNSKLGHEYPMCPGTVAGQFNSDEHIFVNLQFEQIRASLAKSMEMMRRVNPALRFILTVSPVPLAATYTNSHVLVATMASKCILRAVADQLTTNSDFVDYFPSYEIINSPVYKGVFFEPNQRSVNPNGVDFVMNHFFNSLNLSSISNAHTDSRNITSVKDDHLVIAEEQCEEALLEAFYGK